jgi:hypothetical protein
MEAIASIKENSRSSYTLKDYTLKSRLWRTTECGVPMMSEMTIDTHHIRSLLGA